MANFYNMLDYLEWRGDILPSQLPYGEIDYLILSFLSYGKLDEKGSALLGKTIQEIYPIVYPKGKNGLTSTDAERHDLWKEASCTARFQLLKLDAFVLNFDTQTEEQFATMVFSYGEEGYVVFRGTDGTLVGWKEDVNLAFIDEIPSETHAVAFLESISPSYRTLHICGHSKGGILAVYSAFKSSEEVFQKVSSVWSYDGPGLHDHHTKEPRWQALSEKTHAYIPESSVVGMIFTAMVHPIIVKSKSVGVFQHDAFNWYIKGNQLVRIPDTTLSSKVTDLTIKTFFEGCTKEERKVVVNTIYSIIELCGEEEVRKLPEGTFRNLPRIIAAIEKIPEEDRKVIWELAAVLRKSSSTSIKTLIRKRKEEA